MHDLALRAPLRLPPNRVRRSYRGGLLLDRFMNEPEPHDDLTPENWIASVVRSRSPRWPDEGISLVQTNAGDLSLPQLLDQHASELLGETHVARYGQHPALLVKLLDSAIRLGLQCHPTPAQAQAIWGSPFGKTESWLILETRTIDGVEPYVLLGFKQGTSREAWAAATASQDIPAMEAMLHRLPVQPGEVYMVPPRTPHAIGPGLFMVEVQEPSDWTITVEKQSGAVVRSDEACHMGLGWERALDIFDYTPVAGDSLRIEPQQISFDAAATIWQLIGAAQTDRFSAQRLRVTTALAQQTADRFASVVITQGSGAISYGSAGRLEVQRGACLIVPASLGEYTWQNTGTQPLELIFCQPPA